MGESSRPPGRAGGRGPRPAPCPLKTRSASASHSGHAAAAPGAGSPQRRRRCAPQCTGRRGRRWRPWVVRRARKAPRRPTRDGLGGVAPAARDLLGCAWRPAAAPPTCARRPTPDGSRTRDPPDGGATPAPPPRFAGADEKPAGTWPSRRRRASARRPPRSCAPRAPVGEEPETRCWRGCRAALGPEGRSCGDRPRTGRWGRRGPTPLLRSGPAGRVRTWIGGTAGGSVPQGWLPPIGRPGTRRHRARSGSLPSGSHPGRSLGMAAIAERDRRRASQSGKVGSSWARRRQLRPGGSAGSAWITWSAT